MFDSDLKEFIDDEILQKHKALLKTLAVDDAVMCVCKDKRRNVFYLQECCDDYYVHILTKDECIELSELFREIADNI